MELRELIAPGRVLPALKGGDKAQVLAELSRRAAALIGTDAEAVFATLTARERLGSTGLGRGFALPHARLDGLDTLFGLFARLAKPVDFAAIDGKPVDLVFLLLIPRGAADHVAALATISRRMRDEAAVDAMRRATDTASLYRALTGGE